MKMIRNGIWAFLAFGVISTAIFMLKNGEPDKLWWWPLALGFFAWACLPYLAVALFTRKNTESAPALIVVLLTAAVMAGGGFFILWQAFVTHLDPQSGLVFVFLPVYQLVAAALGLLLAWIVKALTRERTEPRSGG